ncbi:MAG: DUF5615 family PIN-like protein [Pseudomonadota bacterium]
MLLDECMGRRFARYITDHEVNTVPQMGWAGIKNGEPLTLAARQFDVLVTVDRNLFFQQRLPKYDIAVVVLRAHSNRPAVLRTLVPKMLEVLPSVRPGEIFQVGV